MDSGERCLFLMKKKQKVLENPYSCTGEQGEDSSSYPGMYAWGHTAVVQLGPASSSSVAE